MRHQRVHVRRDFERQMRMAPRDAEEVLWHCLRNRKFLGLKFRRQHRVSTFILDFFCPELRLAIELDGAPHFTEEGARYDEVRSGMLEHLGIRVVRFVNSEVVTAVPFVLMDLELIALLRSDEIAMEALSPLPGAD